jgi:hypothetical protein
MIGLFLIGVVIGVPFVLVLSCLWKVIMHIEDVT